jgi:hypothetical protein
LCDYHKSSKKIDNCNLYQILIGGFESKRCNLARTMYLVSLSSNDDFSPIKEYIEQLPKPKIE